MQPVCIALLFADKVFREDNGKFGLIGIFDTFNFQQFPAIVPPWWIFVMLSNIIGGKHPFTVNLVHDDTQAVVLPFVGEIEIKNEEMITQVNIPVNAIMFPAPGNYTLTLNIDGNQVTSRSLRVFQISQ